MGKRNEVGIEASGDQRRIVAVLRADMVGSSQLLTSLGVEAAIEARGRVSDAIAACCRSGTVLDTRGDGTVIAFDSASDALVAAWHLQGRLAEDPEAQLRVSVSLEELSLATPLSAAANVRTQELESRCPPGAILTSGPLVRAVRGRSGLSIAAHGDDTYLLTGVDDDPRPAESGRLGCVLFSDVKTRSVADSLLPSTTAAAADMSGESIRTAGGQAVDTNGAGHMAIFASAAAALAAASSMHEQANTYNARADTDQMVSLSIGLSIGEITTSADAHFGVAVVEAARLLEHADAVSTECSSDVVDVAGETAPHTEVGMIAVKGLADPIEVVRFDHGTAAPEALPLPPVLQRDHRFEMVGRDDEFASLGETWEATLTSGSTSVLISGEEGVGKTRLVRDFARSVHRQGAIVLYGSCDEDLARPYAPIAQALRQAVSLDAEIAAAGDAGQGPLARLLGSAKAHVDSGHVGQAELFDAVARALARLAMLRPVLVVIDDLQWGDRDTARLVDHCLGFLTADRVQIMATCRSEAVHAASAVQDFLSSDGRVRPRQVELARLTLPDVVAMLESRKRTPLVGDELGLAEKITATTGGNPLYVEELIVYLVDQGLLVNDLEHGWSLAIDMAELSIPESITDVVLRRCAQLPVSDRDVLGAAAIMGSTFDIEVLAGVVDLDLSTIIGVIESAEVARLVEPAGAPDTFGFSDEICRAALMRHIQPARRSLVHLQIAETLERVRPNHTEALVAHWSAAVGSKARSKAVQYLQIAAERDMAAAAWESVVDRQRQILDLLAADGVEDLSLLGSTHLALGSALRLLGDDDYQPQVMIAADIGRRSRNPQLLFQAATAMMRPGAWVPEAGVVDAAIVAMCEDALLLLGDDDPLQPRVLAVLATALSWDSDPDRRASLVAEAQAIAASSNDPELVGTTLMAELISERRPDLFERRRAVADQVRAIGRATGNAELLFTGTWHVLLDLFERGEVTEATELLSEFHSHVEARRDYFSRYLLSYLGAAIAIARCDPDAAELVETNRVAFEHEPVDSFAVWVLQSGVLAMYAGNLAELLQPIAEAAGMWHEEWGRKWDYPLARTYLDIGDHDAALRTIRSNPEPEADAYWLSSYCPLAQVGLALGLDDVCQSVIDKLTMYRGRIALVGGGIAFVGQASTALGQAHLGLGHLDRAEELFREAAEQAAEVGYPYLESNARRFLAMTLLAKGGCEDAASALLDRVFTLADQHGFALERREADQLKAQLQS